MNFISLSQTSLILKSRTCDLFAMIAFVLHVVYRSHPCDLLSLLIEDLLDWDLLVCFHYEILLIKTYNFFVQVLLHHTILFYVIRLAG